MRATGIGKEWPPPVQSVEVIGVGGRSSAKQTARKYAAALTAPVRKDDRTATIGPRPDTVKRAVRFS